MRVNIDLGRRDPSTHDARNLQPGAEIKRRNRFFQQLWRHTGVYQRAEKHVAADAGKTIEVRNTHKNRFSLFALGYSL